MVRGQNGVDADDPMHDESALIQQGRKKTCPVVPKKTAPKSSKKESGKAKSTEINISEVKANRPPIPDEKQCRCSSKRGERCRGYIWSMRPTQDRCWKHCQQKGTEVSSSES